MYNPAGLASISRPTLNLDASAYAARYYHIPKLVQVQLPDGQGSIEFPGGVVVVSITWTDARWSLVPAERSSTFVLTTTL